MREIALQTPSHWPRSRIRCSRHRRRDFFAAHGADCHEEAESLQLVEVCGGVEINLQPVEDLQMYQKEAAILWEFHTGSGSWQGIGSC